MANFNSKVPEPPARHFGLPLFGPVLVYDLVRYARHSRMFSSRVTYLVVLLLFLGLTGGVATLYTSASGSGGSTRETCRAMTVLTQVFCFTYFLVQILLTAGLTVAYVAPAVAQEKERKTLELLLATALDSRDIVLGKVLGRLARMGILYLAALPVLSAVQFLGGVEPVFVFIGYAATTLVALSVAGVAVLVSVYARRSDVASAATGGILILYFGLCCGGETLIGKGIATASPLFPGGPSGVDVVRTFEAGCPLDPLFRVLSGSSGAEAILSALPGYAAFHLLLAAGTLTLASLRLRPVARNQASGPGRKDASRPAAPPVGERPMVWKECHIKFIEFRGATLVLVQCMMAIPGLFVGALVYLAYRYGWPFGNSNGLAEGYNLSVRSFGMLFACSMPLAAAIAGVQALQRERDKETFDGLLTSPLSAAEILFGMWAGCMWPFRWMWVFLASTYLPALVTGGLSPLALPLLVAATLVYTGTLAAVGLWCSVACRTAVRAAAATVAFVALLMGGHWLLLGPCCYALGIYPRAKVVFGAHAGLTPPAVLGLAFPFARERFPGWFDEMGGEVFPYACVGLVCWAALGGLMWLAVNRRFKALYNRGDGLRPERPDLALCPAPAGE
jgi:ABC-type transport system involved in multi-copper enzyme maturation permease subunit